VSYGVCEGNFRPLIKRVIGVTGDRVEINAAVFVNGEEVENSTLMIER